MPRQTKIRTPVGVFLLSDCFIAVNIKIKFVLIESKVDRQETKRKILQNLFHFCTDGRYDHRTQKKRKAEADDEYSSIRLR